MRRRVRQIVEEKVLEEEDEGTAELMKWVPIWLLNAAVSEY
jgi:hypothetical protein